MIGRNMLLGMLKPLLPKLEGFLKNHENLGNGERAKIVIDLENSKLDIKILAFKQVPKDIERKNDEVVISRILQEISEQEL
tara:strand:- start:805 stop:1047 length:243 start_codon:yes stop_codon:yes gene_type:complete